MYSGRLENLDVVDGGDVKLALIINDLYRPVGYQKIIVSNLQKS